MASALASQLQELARQRQPALPTTIKKGKPSLLFDFRKAADVDLQTIYDIASQGFEELLRVEPRFRPYRESLFNRGSLDINPELQTTEFLAKLDESIHGFCCLLSNHFLSSAAFKALEYLVRRYKANERNVDALMTAALPYHSTNEFVRLVQILALGTPGSLWGWLAKMQTSGASLPRDLLALRCANDRQLLLFICKAASQLGGAAAAAALRPRSQTFLSFYAVLLCEVLAVVKSVDEELVAALLPHLLEGIAKDAVQDYRAATLIIVAELCSRATLGRDFIKVLLNTMLKHTEPISEHIRTVLLVMAHLAVTQPHIRTLSDKTLKYLSALPNAVSELSTLAQRGNIRLGPLLQLITRSLATTLVSSGGSGDNSAGRRCLADLTSLTHSGVLRGEPALALAKTLLEAGGAATATDAVRSNCQQVLRLLDQRYPETTDQAVNAFLEPLRKQRSKAVASAVPTDADGKKQQHGKDERGKKGTKGKKAAATGSDDDASDDDEGDAVLESADAAAAALSPEMRARFDFVRATFSSGGYSAPCGGTMMTLAAALMAPQAAVRRMALQQLDVELTAAGNAAKRGKRASVDGAVAETPLAADLSDARTALTATALERLRDDDLGVVLAALGLSCIKQLPPAALLDALQPLAHRLGEFLYGSAKLPQLKAARKAARKVISLLRSVGAASEALRQAAVLQLLAFVLPSLRDPRIAVEAARSAGELGLPLLAGLAAAQAELESHLKAQDAGELKATDGKAKKGSREAAASAASAGVTAGQDGKGGGKKAAVKAAATAIARSVVSALAGGLTKDVAGRTAELLALVAAGAAAAASDGAASAASRRAQHVLLLAAHASALSAVSSGSPDASQLLRAAVHVSEMLLPYVRFSSSVGEWSADFSEKISAADGLPTEDHLAALQADFFGAQGAVILGTLRSSLAHMAEAASASPVAGDGDTPSAASAAAVARDLRQLAELDCPAVKLQDLPTLLTTRLIPPASRTAFLGGIFLAPSSSATPPALQVLALRVRAALLSADNLCGGLLGFLAALGSLQATVRQAACEGLRRMLEVLQTAPAVLPAAPVSATLSAETATSMVKALLVHDKLLRVDPEASRMLLRAALRGGPAVVAGAKSPSASKKKSAAGHVTAANGAGTPVLELSTKAITDVSTFFTRSLRGLDTSTAGLVCAATLLSYMGPDPAATPPPVTDVEAAAADVSSELFSAGAGYLGRVVAALQEDPLSAAPLHVSVVRQLVALFTPASAAAAADVGHTEDLSRLAELAELAPPPGVEIAAAAAEALAAIRLAAVSRITKELFGELPPSGRTVRELFAVLMGRYEGDSDETVRAAARAALEAIPLCATLLVPLLDPPTPAAPAAAATPAKKKTKKAADATAPSAITAGGASSPLAPAALRDAVAALELLQWRTGIVSPHLLVSAVQNLLRRELPVVGSIASVLTSESTGGEGDDATAAADAAADEAGGKSSLAGYASTLALQALAALAREDSAAEVAMEVAGEARWAPEFDLELAVRSAREAPDAAVRNAALGLLAELASKMPEEALSHVLQVLAVIHQSTALQDDEHSRAVGATALAAVVPAWVASGQSSVALWEQVASSLSTLPAHRRMDVLLALLKALPQVEEGLSEGLLVLLRHAAAPQPTTKTVAATAAADATTPSRAGKAAKEKASKKTAEAAASPVPAAAPASSEPPASEWLPELASQLALQVELPVRLGCCARVMELALQESHKQPQTALPRTVVAFVTAQLKLKAAVTAATASYRRPDPDPVLETACRRLMQAALSQMQLLQSGAAPAQAPSPSPAKLNRAVLAASRGLYGLFAALQGVMAADTYLQALLTLAEHPADKVKRRAIKLFTDKVRGVRAEIEDQIELPQRVRDAKLRQAAEAAARACVMLPPLLRPEAAASPLTRQLALIALAAIAAEFSGQQHAELLAGVPAVLESTKDAHASIRASALATVAAFVRALGSRLVPVLPATVAAAVAAADSAWSRLQRAGSGSAAAIKDGDAEMEGAQEADVITSSDDSDAAEESGRGDAGVRRRSRRPGASDQEDAALELSSALACLNALVETLGGFLSPHLQSVLAILLNPRVLACRAAGCDRFAASIRARLPTAVPPRLLFPALYDRLQPCLDAVAEEEGGSGTVVVGDAEAAAAPTTALLQMVAAATAALEPKVAVQYHEQIFAFLLRALDVRQRRPTVLTAAGGEGALDAVEAAAVRAVVALVMKLSEARFKPLFLRLLEWASTLTVPEGGGGEPSYLGRMVALFGVVNALADRLRSVLVPYYRYLMDLVVQHLEDDVAGGGGKGRSKKKQKRGGAAAGDAPTAAAAAAGEAATEVQQRLAWLLRLRIVRALHRCFLHDSVGFLDAERFARLQPALVSQLDATPPDAALPYLLSPHHADVDLASYVALGASTRVYTATDGAAAAGPLGAAAVGCLLAMAVAANSDALWKPLNHATLMLTRSGSARTRALALEVVAQLVDRLREEYLVLLPEALPFLSELLEDTDAAVAARVREVVAQLEEISGEKLDEYLKV